ncbi:MAG TPA: ferredoxin [Intrasporangium sp.]|uniref:ferredoxin n=1 Tax=Intrasporangium sp. TaxID=1925024 RepID=UPI002D786C87|nr:ferredoxin [Intrasporangium sp.]HET7397397.1 ferredoxin [Intrasporangium sp.]
MRITIDSDKCCGYGDCVLAAPDVFDIGDDNVAYVLVGDPGPELQDQAAQGAAACPVEAIEIAS